MLPLIDTLLRVFFPLQFLIRPSNNCKKIEARQNWLKVIKPPEVEIEIDRVQETVKGYHLILFLGTFILE